MHTLVMAEEMTVFGVKRLCGKQRLASVNWSSTAFELWLNFCSLQDKGVAVQALI